MTVTVQSNFMALLSNHPAFFWERFQGMAGNEPSRGDVVLLEHFEQSTNTNRTSK